MGRENIPRIRRYSRLGVKIKNVHSDFYARGAPLRRYEDAASAIADWLRRARR